MSKNQRKNLHLERVGATSFESNMTKMKADVYQYMNKNPCYLRRIQNPVKHFRCNFFAKITIELFGFPLDATKNTTFIT